VEPAVINIREEGSTWRLTVPKDVMPMPSFKMTCSGRSGVMIKLLHTHKDHQITKDAYPTQQR
jgi:hypothetical protein